MKRLILSLAILAISLFVFTPAALAATDPLAAACQQGAQDSSVCQDTNDNNPLVGPDGVITRVTQLLITGVAAVSVIMIIIGGFKYVVASGDSNNIQSAKNTILFAVIGLVIALVAQAIVLFVLRKI